MLTVKHVDYKRGVALVSSTRKTFPVTLQKWLRFLVCPGDIATVKKSVVTGEWIMTDYTRTVGDDYYD